MEEQTEKVENEAFDEAVELSESESVDSPDEEEEENQSTMSNDAIGEDTEQVMNRSFDEAIELSPSASVASASGAMSNAAPGNSPPVMPQQDESSSSDSDDDDQQDGSAAQGAGNQGAGIAHIEGGYDPAEFANLDCSDEIKELFTYITRYTAHNIELEHVLKPFIPDFIPSVGDIDAFLKIPKPDGTVDNIGLTHLGEPALVQSDGTIIEMELRAMTKKADLHAQSVSSIVDAQHNVPQIKKWIESVEELHTSKPATEVVYKHPMPDIEALMQVWPAIFEEELERTPLPPANLDCTLDQYARIICAMFDIPCRESTIPSLHVLFTLFSEFNQNQHFNQNMAAASPAGSGLGFGNDFDNTNTGIQVNGMTVIGQQMPMSPLGIIPA